MSDYAARAAGLQLHKAPRGERGSKVDMEVTKHMGQDEQAADCRQYWHYWRWSTVGAAAFATLIRASHSHVDL